MVECSPLAFFLLKGICKGNKGKTFSLTWLKDISDVSYLNLGAQQAHTAGLLDLVLSLLGEVLGLHDDGAGGQVTTAQQLVVALWREDKNIR